MNHIEIINRLDKPSKDLIFKIVTEYGGLESDLWHDLSCDKSVPYESLLDTLTLRVIEQIKKYIENIYENKGIYPCILRTYDGTYGWFNYNIHTKETLDNILYNIAEQKIMHNQRYYLKDIGIPYPENVTHMVFVYKHDYE